MVNKCKRAGVMAFQCSWYVHGMVHVFLAESCIHMHLMHALKWWQHLCLRLFHWLFRALPCIAMLRCGDVPGGGRKVIRCELSLDGGETWRLADIERHEKPTPYNKYWCWVFWSVAVPGAHMLMDTLPPM